MDAEQFDMFRQPVVNGLMARLERQAERYRFNRLIANLKAKTSALRAVK